MKKPTGISSVGFFGFQMMCLWLKTIPGFSYAFFKIVKGSIRIFLTRSKDRSMAKPSSRKGSKSIQTIG